MVELFVDEFSVLDRFRSISTCLVWLQSTTWREKPTTSERSAGMLSWHRNSTAQQHDGTPWIKANFRVRSKCRSAKPVNSSHPLPSTSPRQIIQNERWVEWKALAQVKRSKHTDRSVRSKTIEPDVHCSTTNHPFNPANFRRNTSKRKSGIGELNRRIAVLQVCCAAGSCRLEGRFSKGDHWMDWLVVIIEDCVWQWREQGRGNCTYY